MIVRNCLVWIQAITVKVTSLKFIVKICSMANQVWCLFSFQSSSGILEVSPLYTAERQVIVCPGHRNGSVMIYDMNGIRPNASSTPISINAHKSELACISLNINGRSIRELK